MAAPELHLKRLMERATFEWQLLEPVFLDAMTKVAPGRALRYYENRKETEAVRERGKPVLNPRPEPSQSRKIESGARSIVRASVHSLSKTRLDIEHREDGEWFRLRERRAVKPGTCAACGHTASKGVGLDPTQPRAKPRSNVLPFRAPPATPAEVAQRMLKRRSGVVWTTEST